MVLASLPAPTPLPLPSLGQVEQVLHAVVRALVVTGWTSPAERGRPAILPAAMLWSGVLLCVLTGWQSQAELWRLLVQSGSGTTSASPSATKPSTTVWSATVRRHSRPCSTPSRRCWPSG